MRAITNAANRAGSRETVYDQRRPRLRSIALSIMLAASGIMSAFPAGAAPATGALSVDDAFALSVRRTVDDGVAFDFRIADGYYLYRSRITAQTANGKPVKLHTKPGIAKTDPYFGRLQIYHGFVEATVPGKAIGKLPANSKLQVSYQGCQTNGICYPPQTRAFRLIPSS